MKTPMMTRKVMTILLRNQLLLPLTNLYLLLNLLPTELVTAERLVSIYLLSMSAVKDHFLYNLDGFVMMIFMNKIM